MKTLCSEGFRVSNADRKAFAHYVLKSEADWSLDALKGMVNKAVKTILRDYFEIYKSKQEETVSADITIIIPAIIAMEEFKLYKMLTPAIPIVDRKQAKDQEIWQGGFNVEDYEHQALEAFYENPEEMLAYFMENKVYQRKKAFAKTYEAELIQDKTVTHLPARVDDLIDLITARDVYKNRVQQESESGL